MKRLWIVLIIVVLLAGGGFFAYQQYTQAQAASTSNLQTQVLSRGQLTAMVSGTGTVRANQTSMLNWQTTGRVARVNVKEGDLVTAGQVLAELAPDSLAQTIILAQSDLVTAQRNLDNLKNSSVARSQAQQALANSQKAVKDAQTNRDNLNYTRGQNGNVDAAYAELYLAQDALKKAQDRFDLVSSRDATDPARASAQAALVAAQQKVTAKQQ